jgi:hypothetical protein
MDDDKLRSYAEMITGLRIDPDLVFGKHPAPGSSQIRIRSYPRGSKDVLIVQTIVRQDGPIPQEEIHSIQLKRLHGGNTVETVWEVKPQPRPVMTPHQIEQVRPEPSFDGPTDVPPEKLFRSIGGNDIAPPDPRTS